MQPRTDFITLIVNLSTVNVNVRWVSWFLRPRSAGHKTLEVALGTGAIDELDPTLRVLFTDRDAFDMS